MDNSAHRWLSRRHGNHHLTEVGGGASVIFTLTYLYTVHAILSILSLTYTRNGMALARDFAPGEDHIAFRAWGKTFYLPSLFHLAPTTGKIIPLAIRDVLRARNLLEVYGVQGLGKHSEGYILVNNYPVKTIKITGRLLSYVYKNFDHGNYRNPYNFYLLNLDDCSGDRLSMHVKILQSDLQCSMSAIQEGYIFEVTGSLAFAQDYERQLVGVSASVIGHYTDLELEIKCWSRILRSRKELQKPWKYRPTTGFRSSSVPHEPKFSRNDYLRRKGKSELVLETPSEPARLPVATDSFEIYPQRHDDDEVIEIIDLTDEEDTHAETSVSFAKEYLALLSKLRAQSPESDSDVMILDLPNFVQEPVSSPDSVYFSAGE